MSGKAWGIFHYITVFTLLALISACGGGGGGTPPNSNPPPGNHNITVTGNLSVTIKDTPGGAGIDGLFISLYNPDNRTISQTVLTNSNGIADFGEQTGPVTITVSYDNQYIRTYMGIDPRDYTFYRNYRNWQNKTFSNTVNNAVAEQPGGNLTETSYTGDFGRGTFFWLGSSNSTTTASLVENSNAWFVNDTEHLLIYSKSFDPTNAGVGFPNDFERGELFKYALIPVDMTQTEPLSIVSNYVNFQDPVPLNWSTNGINALFSVYAQTADSAFYQVGFHDQSLSHAQSGTTMIADNLPIINKFMPRAVNLQDNTSSAHSSFMGLATSYNQRHIIEHGVRQGYDTDLNPMPSSVTMNFADSVVTGLSYNVSAQGDKQFDFTVSGESEIDHIIFYYGNDLIDWWIFTNGRTRSITLPDLPAFVDSRVRDSINLLDNTEFGNYIGLGVSVVNLDNYNTYNDSVQVYMNSYEPLDYSNSEQWSTYETHFYLP